MRKAFETAPSFWDERYGKNCLFSLAVAIYLYCTPTAGCPYAWWRCPLSWVMSSSSLWKRSEIHHIPARATTTYMILAKIVSAPPHIQATASNEKRPTSPQLSDPIIEIISAILFMIILETSIQILDFIHLLKDEENSLSNASLCKLFAYYAFLFQSSNSGRISPNASFRIPSARFSIRETYEREIPR